jgi:signal transduction histidine kinase
MAKGQLADSLRQQLKYATASERINILNDLSRAYWSESLDKSISYALEALSGAEYLNDKKGKSDALNRLGNAEYLRHNYSEAIAYYTRSLDTRLSIDDQQGVLASYNNLYLAHNLLGNSKTAVDYAKKALDLSIEAGDRAEIARYSNILGASKSEVRNFEKARPYLERALEINRGLGDTLGIASALSHLGSMYQRMCAYDKALEYLFQALYHYESNGNRDGIALIKNNIGIIHKRLDNLDLALEYYGQSLEIYRAGGENNSSMASLLNNIGIIWYEKEDYETALDYYTQAMETWKHTGFLHGIATTHNNTGLLFTRLGNYKDALESFLASAEINKTQGRDFSLANNYNNLGELFLLQEDYEKALEYLDEALEMALQINARELIYENYLFQSTIFTKTKDFQRSLMCYELFDSYRDSIYTLEAASRIAELQVRKYRERQMIELDLLQKDHDIRQLQIKKQHAMLWFYGGFGLLIAIFGGALLGLYGYKTKLKVDLQQKNHDLEDVHLQLALSEKNLQILNNTKDKFFSILAHDLKNPFNALLGFSETLNQNYRDLSRAQIFTYIEIIYKSATNLYMLLENLLEWSKSQTGNIIIKPEKFGLKDFAEFEVNNACISAANKNIDLHANIDPAIEVFADKKLLSTVIRNLLNNAVKFTHRDGKVVISANEKENNIEVSVTDNGIGIGESEQNKLFSLDYNITTAGTNDERGTGLGLILCKEFVEKNGGELTVTSEVDKGSTFIFTIPK